MRGPTRPALVRARVSRRSEGSAAASTGTAVHFGAEAGASLPVSVVTWLAARRVDVVRVESPDDLLASAIRGRPRLAVVDARCGASAEIGVAVRRLKLDSYTGVVPTVVLVPKGAANAVARAFAAGADEVLSDAVSAVEVHARLDALLTRSDRDTGVHPSTRLPGAPEIEDEYARRIATRVQFGVCYVDLDHFKEFNDRYSYHAGDRVIRLLAKILHDVVKGLCGEHGFVGHIGGDDFICVTPANRASAVCEAVVEVFDLLIPWQYSTQDRTTGYYFGKDRRGQLHRVPLMTVSIGVVTNANRDFTHPAEISELATEMKSYAKTFAGSVYVVDRRHETPAGRSATDGASADREPVEAQ